MVKIECTVNQKYGILKVLEKAKEYRRNDFEKGEITQEHLDYDINVINNLIDVVNGKVTSDYQMDCKEYKEKTAKKRYAKDEYKLPIHPIEEAW